jgi:hypothetical protein
VSIPNNVVDALIKESLAGNFAVEDRFTNRFIVFLMKPAIGNSNEEIFPLYYLQKNFLLNHLSFWQQKEEFGLLTF